MSIELSETRGHRLTPADSAAFRDWTIAGLEERAREPVAGDDTAASRHSTIARARGRVGRRAATRGRCGASASRGGLCLLPTGFPSRRSDRGLLLPRPAGACDERPLRISARSPDLRLRHHARGWPAPSGAAHLGEIARPPTAASYRRLQPGVPAGAAYATRRRAARPAARPRRAPAATSSGKCAPR